MNACCTGCSPDSPPILSMVVISCPGTDHSGVSHDCTGLPSKSTLHAPHWPSPQPKRVPLSFRSLRRMYSSGVFASARTSESRPLTRIVNVSDISGWDLRDKRLNLRYQRLRLLDHRAVSRCLDFAVDRTGN